MTSPMSTSTTAISQRQAMVIVAQQIKQEEKYDFLSSSLDGNGTN
jgi:hypothetical protein